MGNGEKLNQMKLLIKRRVRQLPKTAPVMHLTRPTLMENGNQLREKEKKMKKKNHGEDLFTIVIFIIFVFKILVFQAEAFSFEFWQN